MSVPYRARTVFRFFYQTVFYRDRDRFRTAFTVSLTVRNAKRTEPLILTVRFLVFDREPYRTKIGIFIRLLLRTANRTASKWAPLPIYI